MRACIPVGMNVEYSELMICDLQRR